MYVLIAAVQFHSKYVCVSNWGIENVNNFSNWKQNNNSTHTLPATNNEKKGDWQSKTSTKCHIEPTYLLMLDATVISLFVFSQKLII